MGENTAIAWCDHTHNPWWGCQRVSPGCEHCYAEAFAKRTGHKVWGGKDTARRMLSASNWLKPLKWHREAIEAGDRRRVFCASMADVCEDRRDLDAPREWLWELIRCTCAGPHNGLDWLLLTKRPENLIKLVPEDVLRMCWVGTTAEDQQRADERIPHLLRAPALVRFVSAEPLLGPLDLSPYLVDDLHRMGRAPRVELDWVIVGGESGAGARPCATEWLERIASQCKGAGVPVFVKQLGKVIVSETRTATEEEWREFSRLGLARPNWQPDPAMRAPNGEYWAWFGRLQDPKGGDPAEWPRELRVREFPEVRRG